IVPGMTDELVEVLISEGFLSYDDLTFQDPNDLAELLSITPEEAQTIINFAEEASAELERMGTQERTEEKPAETSEGTESEVAAEDGEGEVSAETPAELVGVEGVEAEIESHVEGTEPLAEHEHAAGESGTAHDQIVTPEHIPE